MNKKVRAIAVSVLVILSFVVVVIHIPPTVEAPTTIYVPTDYPTIQEAIDAAQTGDTVYVYSGTYYENVMVDKTINLIGQNRDTTIIKDATKYDFTVWIVASWVNITGFTINGSVNGNRCVVYIMESYNTISENTILVNVPAGALACTGLFTYTTISGNNILSSENGIFLAGSHNRVENNYFESYDTSIFLVESSDNIIMGNEFNFGGFGIDIGYGTCNNNKIIKNIFYTNDFGIHIMNSVYNNIFDNNISLADYGICLDNSSGNNITSNTIIRNDGCGIHIMNSVYNNIFDNNISLNDHGIVIGNSNRNNITGNTVISNRHGLHLEWDSNGNTINNNDILENEIGIYLDQSSSNNITDNTMKDDGIFISGYQLEHWNTHDIDISNTLNGKPVFYLKNQDGGIIPASAGQVILANCTNINIENQEIGKTYVGVELGFSSNNDITNTNISESDYGVYFYSSSGNTIKKTNIFSNSNNVAQFSSSINNAFINCSIWNSSGYDFYLDGNSHAALLNTTFTRTSIFYDDSLSTLTVKWFLDVSVIDDMGNPVPNAKVKVEDNLNGSYNETFSTGGDGHVRWILVTEYIENYYGKTYYTPHRIIAWTDTKVGYAYPEPFIDQSKTVTIVLHNGTLLDMEPGWNLVSLPRPQLTTNIQTVLESIERRYDAVQWYDILDNTDPWKHYHTSKPSSMNDLDELNHTMGFWLHITDPEGTTLVIFGDELSSSQNIPLHLGWNLVGYPSTLNKTRDVALGTLNFGSDIDSIWTYNATIQEWVELDEPTDYYEIGQGYWVHSKVEKVWNVPL